MSSFETTVVNRGKTRELSYSSFRTLYLLLGGTGMKVGMRLRRRVLEAHGVAQLPFQEYLWLDTDPGDMNNQNIGDVPAVSRRLQLPADDVVSLVLPHDRIRQILDNPHEFPWLRSWLDLDMVRDLGDGAQAIAGAAQIRALGRLSFTEQFQAFRRSYERRYERLARPSVLTDAARYGYKVEDSAMEVAIVCSLAGGTGSGCFIEAARVVRELSKGTPVNIKAYLLLPSIYKQRIDGQQAWDEVRANAYAALQELNALSALSAEGFRTPPLWIENFKVDRPGSDPFNQVYLVDMRNDADVVLDEPFDEDAYNMVADSLYFDFEQSEFGVKMRSHRCNVGPHLQSTSYLSFPIQDDNSGLVMGDGPKPAPDRSYVFRFPNAFGAFGLARIPFERHRLRRAAGSWLAERMFRVLVDKPAKELPRAEVLSVVVMPELAKSKLTVDEVLNRILQDGETLATFDQAASNAALEKLRPLYAEIESRFKAEGLADDARLDRLETSDSFARQLKDKIHRIIQESCAGVMSSLSDRGARSAWGEHLLAIEDVQNTILAEFKESFEGFVLRLLSEPRQHGYQVAVLACEIIRDQLGRLTAQALEPPAPIELPALALEPGADVRRAVEMRASADALVLPMYRGIAQRFYLRQNRRFLQDGANECARRARAFVEAAGNAFGAWARDQYRAVAAAHSRKLFDALRDFVGDEVQVDGDPAEPDRIDVVATGLRKRLLTYREACEEARSFFVGMHRTYSSSTTSSRDGEDLTPYEGIKTAVEGALSEGDVRDSVAFEDRLVEQWERFFTEHNMLPPGRSESFRGGVDDLLRRAAGRGRNRKLWDEVIAWAENWTIKRLEDGGYLEGEDAIERLNSRPSSYAARQLRHVAKGAQPWLPFGKGRSALDTLQPIVLVGAPSVQSQALDDWRRGDRKALGEPQIIENHSGSVVMYAEKMVFPLYAVRAMSDLEEGYRQVQGRRNRPHDITRRYTVRDHLDLPVVLPPRDTAQAQIWFQSDRLALEAVLLGVFQAGDDGEVLHQFEDPVDGVRHTRLLRGTLGSIAATLRLDPELQQAIREAVSGRIREVFDDRIQVDQALALAYWTQNEAFPRKTHKYLEHELAASLFQKWREAAVMRAGQTADSQIPAVKRFQVRTYAVPSPVHAWALAAEQSSLLSLQASTGPGGADEQVREW